MLGEMGALSYHNMVFVEEVCAKVIIVTGPGYCIENVGYFSDPSAYTPKKHPFTEETRKKTYFQAEWAMAGETYDNLNSLKHDLSLGQL